MTVAELARKLEDLIQQNKGTLAVHHMDSYSPVEIVTVTEESVSYSTETIIMLSGDYGE